MNHLLSITRSNKFGPNSGSPFCLPYLPVGICLLRLLRVNYP